MPRVYPYHEQSESAHALANELGWTLMSRSAKKFTGRLKPWIVNWGSSTMPEHVRACKIINYPEDVAEAQNKLRLFEMTLGTGLMPGFDIDLFHAKIWMREEPGTAIVCRTELTGHSGAGIVLATKPEDLVDAPLYTRYEPKTAEYRVHIFNGEVIDVQQKRRRLEVPDDQVNWQIRNHENGFIYAREKVERVPAVELAAEEVMAYTNLIFGAVDVIWNDYKKQAYVLEINTAPGLQGQTVKIYADALRKFIQ